MSIPQIVTLLGFCLKNTYFLFQGKYYEQVHDAAIHSPISLLIAKLFMEEFEAKAISTAPTPSSVAQIHRQHFHYPTGRTHPPLPPNTLIHRTFEVKAINTAPTPLSMAQVHRKHFHYPTGRTHPPLPPAHLFTGPTHSVHYGGFPIRMVPYPS